MAHEPESNRNDAMIARAGKRKWGYDTRQVDAFLARAHKLYESEVPKLTQQDIGNISFDLRKNGYIIPQVDAALSRLSRAVSDRRTSWQITQYGRQQWLTNAVALQQKLAVHAMRADRERFAPGRDGDPSYDRKQVDRLVDQVVAKSASQLGLENTGAYSDDNLADITADRVSNVIFTQRKGKHGYDERQVDYYLVRAIELLQQLESYVRLGIGDNLSGAKSAAKSSQAAQSAPASDDTVSAFGTRQEELVPSKSVPSRAKTRAAEPVASIAPVPVEPTVEDASHLEQPVDAEDDGQFDQLHQAEQAIFDGADAAQVPQLDAPLAEEKVASPVPDPQTVPGRKQPATRAADSLRKAPAARVRTAAPAAPVDQNSSSLAALAKTPAQPQAADDVPAVGPAKRPSRHAATAAPLEETSQFNPLTDWDDDTGSGQTPSHSSTSVISEPEPEPSPEESLFSVKLPQVNVDIPSLGFPSLSEEDILDETRR
ncbi:cell division protein DivIVA [Bombiscardovia apis]|uniref:Cell division protein DivIVA n=1 Tax=Bombiscardovia apis TaxID=2932182 RepID=A0ABN6SHF8_9BIFI|nr:DivIVA domain-containing protein [Bombiscardovia apis]BDR54351.1 cell division protein DivIVA [Bombiscardovia apis]